jgi:hypothetical protein
MGQIDVVYGAYYNRLFSTKNGVAVSGDFVTLALSSAASIATMTATKTIFSALGTGFSGIALSVDKNVFAQQSFPVIGVAMQTRRDKVRATVISNLALDTTQYPLLAVKRDLVAYLNAGTLASGLQELQEEAGAATAATAANPTGGTPAPAGLTAAGGDSQVSLVWAAVNGATSYNVYWATSAGVTPTTGSKISGIVTNSYTHTGLTNGTTTYYYIVTALSASGESAASNQVSATPAAAPVAGPPTVPTGLTAAAGDSRVPLVWAAVNGATSYNVKRSTTSGGPHTTIASPTATNYTDTGLTNGTTYYYIVTAVNTSGESPPSNQASAKPTASVALKPALKLTAH